MLFFFIPGTLKRNSSISCKPVMANRALAAFVVEDHCPGLGDDHFHFTSSFVFMVQMSAH